MVLCGDLFNFVKVLKSTNITSKREQAKFPCFCFKDCSYCPIFFCISWLYRLFPFGMCCIDVVEDIPYQNYLERLELGLPHTEAGRPRRAGPANYPTDDMKVCCGWLCCFCCVFTHETIGFRSNVVRRSVSSALCFIWILVFLFLLSIDILVCMIFFPCSILCCAYCVWGATQTDEELKNQS